MKKLMIIATIMVTCVAANAQIYVGGGIGFNSHDPGKGDKTTTIAIAPEIGYTLDESTALGIAIGYGHSKAGDIKSDVFSVSPYFRYTFAKIGAVGIFADAGLDYTHTKVGDLKNNAWGLGVKPGLAIAVNDKLSFVTKVGFIGYQSSKDDIDGAETISDFGLSLDGADLEFAVYYSF